MLTKTSGTLPHVNDRHVESSDISCNVGAIEFITKRDSSSKGMVNENLMSSTRHHEHFNSSSQPPLIPLHVKFESIASKV